MPFVFDFDHAHRRPPMEMKDLLGGKGANLAEMTSVLDLPVPPGFTIATTACRNYMESGWPEALTGEVVRARAMKLFEMTSHGLGGRVPVFRVKRERPPDDFSKLWRIGRIDVNGAVEPVGDSRQRFGEITGAEGAFSDGDLVEETSPSRKCRSACRNSP